MTANNVPMAAGGNIENLPFVRTTICAKEDTQIVGLNE